MSVEKEKGKRLLKNTAVLYARMIFLMLVGLYTSRVILSSLGVVDYGVYNVVGGFVALFAVLSQSLSSACSRFLNFEMGKGDKESLKVVFSSSVTIQYFLAIFIAICAEIVGLWFLNNKLVIPADRLEAANWVFHLSVFTFCSNLISVPYNAAIIAHEQMKTFAFIGIFEGLAKLLVSYLVYISVVDKLIFYALGLCLIQLVVRVMYVAYCRKNFEECHYKFIYEKKVLFSMFSYAGWNMIGAVSGVLRTQGGTVLINLFFGPTANAARSVANQVLHAVSGFVQNFLTAVKPQITQSYASGNHDYLMTLLFKSSRGSFFLLLVLCVPIIVNTDYILSLWLKTVPDESSPFIKLTLLFTMVESISSPLITAQLATGNIRNYQIIVGGIQLLNLPISYLIFRFFSAPSYSFLIVAIVLSVVCLIARLIMLKGMIGLDVNAFLKNVILPILKVLGCIIALYFSTLYYKNGSFLNFCVFVILSFVTTVLLVYFVGLPNDEKQFLKTRLKKLTKR